ncbi:MAG: pilin assembly protein [Pseudomonas sp.]|uniref:pilin assembly protein n=1 Tax=Pseudomonas sp. TaxID=306 RepID=UPI003393C8FA
MKIRDLVRQWEQNASGRLTRSPYQVHLDLEAAARLAALAEMYPKRSPEALLGELIGAALEELEASLPYVKGSKVVATDEQGDPLYEDIGPTPRFLALSRKHLRELGAAADAASH